MWPFRRKPKTSLIDQLLLEESLPTGAVHSVKFDREERQEIREAAALGTARGRESVVRSGLGDIPGAWEQALHLDPDLESWMAKKAEVFGLQVAARKRSERRDVRGAASSALKSLVLCAEEERIWTRLVKRHGEDALRGTGPSGRVSRISGWAILAFIHAVSGDSYRALRMVVIAERLAREDRAEETYRAELDHIRSLCTRGRHDDT